MTPFYRDASVCLFLDDSRNALARLPSNSIDAAVTDAPYEFGFMGKRWDATGISFDPVFWAGALRVLKPGAHLLACGGTRTYHRMACAIEDAGFEIRDSLAWLYGSGFPKSLNLGDGLGTALKPAFEPITLARKPFRGTVAANLAQHGTGAINVDACRIGDSRPLMATVSEGEARDFLRAQGRSAVGEQDGGRWPANVVIDDVAAAVIDEQSGQLHANANATNNTREGGIWSTASGGGCAGPAYFDAGGASRFYYCAKPSREERDLGLAAVHQSTAGEATDRADGSAGLNSPRAGAGRTGGARNTHPTVKPLSLMRWLVRLVTPPNGVVIDPFLGSGTTGIAARLEHRRIIGIEREAEYMEIAVRRIKGAFGPLFADAAAADEAEIAAALDASQPSLL